MLQFFFPQSALCPIAFHLGISIHALGSCDTCFGHVTAAWGNVTCYKSLMHATGHVMCPLVLVTWKVKGAKHDKVGRKKKGNGQKND